MDVRTLFVVIGIGYALVALLLLVSERPRTGTPTSLLAIAYFVIASGVFLQAGRPVLPAIIAIGFGNLLAWIGLELQAWAALAMSSRPVSVRVQRLVGATTVIVGIALAALPAQPRAGLASLVYAACFSLTAWALVTWRTAPVVLRNVTAGLVILLAATYGARALLVLAGIIDPSPLPEENQPFSAILYTTIFATAVSSAFGLILLGKRVAEVSLEAALLQTETILGTLTSGVVITDGDCVERANTALAAMIGCGPVDVIGRPFTSLFADRDEAHDWQAAMTASLHRDGRHQAEIRLRRNDGGDRWTLAQTAALDWKDGRQRLVISLTDISELKAVQVELDSRASTDELTRLLNRRSFLLGAKLELSRAMRMEAPCCLALIDLDRLKEINDQHGHAAGDRALLTFADACRHVLREVDLVARLGGDEFAVILQDTSLAEGRAVMDRLLQALAMHPVTIQGALIPVSGSVGIAQHSHGETLESLMERADRLMYSAKSAGRSLIAMDQDL